MPADLSTEISVTIQAPAAKVWEALTKPELIKECFFGVDTVTDWKPGSTIVHKGEWQGEPYEDKGTIVKIDAPRLLVHSHWSAVSGLPDRPENYQEVTWRLAGQNGKTELHVTEVNLPSEQAQSASKKGWEAVLHNLKAMLDR